MPSKDSTDRDTVKQVERGMEDATSRDVFVPIESGGITSDELAWMDWFQQRDGKWVGCSLRTREDTVTAGRGA